jgi:hypothetical protein
MVDPSPASSTSDGASHDRTGGSPTGAPATWQRGHMTADASGPVRPEVVLLSGVAGAGKTTYALGLEALGYVRLSVDEEVWAANGRHGVGV